MIVNNLNISVCVPTYNAALTITDTLRSILGQSDKDFELVIVDNCSTDNTLKLVSKFKDKRIKVYKNKSNLGCGGNLTVCVKKSKGDIVYFVSADDLIDVNTIKLVRRAFNLSEKIGVVARPYFWFDSEVDNIVRTTIQFKEDLWVKNIEFDNLSAQSIIKLSDQISGIGLRKKFIRNEFSNSPFLEIASVILPMLTVCEAYIIKTNVVAVRMSTSGSKISSVYINSPMMGWLNLIRRCFNAKKYSSLVSFLQYNFVASNYVGLVQIRSFGTYAQLLREIWYLIKLRPDNILNFKFWGYSLVTLLTTRKILIKLTAWYKERVNSKFIPNIEFKTA